jgi:hypothetical protein
MQTHSVNARALSPCPPGNLRLRVHDVYPVAHLEIVRKRLRKTHPPRPWCSTRDGVTVPGLQYFVTFLRGQAQSEAD